MPARSQQHPLGHSFLACVPPRSVDQSRFQLDIPAADTPNWAIALAVFGLPSSALHLLFAFSCAITRLAFGQCSELWDFANSLDHLLNEFWVVLQVLGRFLIDDP
jgi:hypothetical protein